MKIEAAQAIYPAADYSGRTVVVLVEANGGSVDVETPFDAGWLTIETLTADGVTVLPYWLLDGDLRISPSGGARFGIMVR